MFAEELEPGPSHKPVKYTKMLEFAKKLINRGADINHVSQTSNYGASLLILAIKEMKHYAITFLLDYNADPHIMDLSGRDACDYA